MKKILFFLFLFSPIFIVQAQTTPPCVALTGSLSYGATDQYPGPVTLLQNYLVSVGYLTVQPTGHFGPATLAAVKNFQKANGISMTGTVGPITRAAIQKKSCPAVTPPSTSYYGNTPPAPVVTTVAAPVSTITSPASGATLSIGKLYPISWNSSTNYPYNIVLEQLGGAGAGFIATNLSGGAGYSWRAGNVFSSAAQADQTVATGTYRVRITAATGGVSDGDPVSGWFTLIGPPLALNSVSPTSLPVDGRSTAVIYGTGLNSSSVVYFDQQYGARANVQYISPDGTIMVITVPSSVSIGAHSLFIMNQYGTISNSLPFWTTVASQ